MAKIYLSGIGGSGMSAIAGFLHDRGHVIAGSDRTFDIQPDNITANILREKSISIFKQDGSKIDSSFDLIISSTAVESNNPDIIRAHELGLPIKTRPEFLNQLISEYKTIAVAGTSGKSTIAGMLAFIMNQLGLEPNYIGGGKVKNFFKNNCTGNYLYGKSDLMVFEACESDGSIVNYHPEYTVISNLSLDHNPVEDTAGMFKMLGENTNRTVFINADDSNLEKIKFKNSISFSIENFSDFRAKDITYNPFDTIFTIDNVIFRVSLPGKYNVYNALSCISLLSNLNISLKDIAEVIPDFKGITRRFDVHLYNGKYLVIDDYAHNPHKIESLMQTVKKFRERICYIFQPHGFGPTKLMKDGYIKTFVNNLRDPDYLVLLPIFYAGGTAGKDISSEDLAIEINNAGKSAQVFHERAEIFNMLDKYDTYVIFGARDDTLSDYARQIAGKLNEYSV